MISALVLAAVWQTRSYSAFGGFDSYGPGPAIGYSCPAFLSVSSGAAHAVTAYVNDLDVYKHLYSPYDLQMFDQPYDINIWSSFGSGSVLDVEGWVAILPPPSDSRRWGTWSIKAPEVAGDETLITYDCFLAKDMVSGVRHDADTPRFTTVVQINGSDPRGVSDRSR